MFFRPCSWSTSNEDKFINVHGFRAVTDPKDPQISEDLEWEEAILTFRVDNYIYVKPSIKLNGVLLHKSDDYKVYMLDNISEILFYNKNDYLVNPDGAVACFLRQHEMGPFTMFYVSKPTNAKNRVSKHNLVELFADYKDVQSIEDVELFGQIPQPRILIADIETAASVGFPDPDVDPIVAFSWRSSVNPEPGVIINLDKYGPGEYNIETTSDEKDLLNRIIEIIHEIDPHYIVFHNGSNFDVPYLNDRFAKYDLSIDRLGRTNIKSKVVRHRYQSFIGMETALTWKINGTHILDTLPFYRAIWPSWENHKLGTLTKKEIGETKVDFDMEFYLKALNKEPGKRTPEENDIVYQSIEYSKQDANVLYKWWVGGVWPRLLGLSNTLSANIDDIFNSNPEKLASFYFNKTKGPFFKSSSVPKIEGKPKVFRNVELMSLNKLMGFEIEGLTDDLSTHIWWCLGNRPKSSEFLVNRYLCLVQGSGVAVRLTPGSWIYCEAPGKPIMSIGRSKLNSKKTHADIKLLTSYVEYLFDWTPIPEIELTLEDLVTTIKIEPGSKYYQRWSERNPTKQLTTWLNIDCILLPDNDYAEINDSIDETKVLLEAARDFEKRKKTLMSIQ